MNTRMKTLAAALFLCMGTAPAFSQVSNAGSTSNSGASSVSGAGNGYVGSVGSTSGSSANTSSGATAQSGMATVSVSISNGTNADGSPTAGSGNSGSNDAHLTYSGTQTIKTNPVVQAPGLTTTLSDTCMGSISMGLSLAGFGATGGTTMVDEACVRRLDAREFRSMGFIDVALALLCQSDANRRAVEATGHLCPGTTAPMALQAPETATARAPDPYYSP
jgi:hypothetical protein